ncbi:MAG: aspartate aminotransferase family protein [Actinobacteria bacterium]|nr:aspartate aminotransferase family protein [Actinomycetota bacterium]
MVKPESKNSLPLVAARKAGTAITPAMLQKSAKAHLWMHFTRHSTFDTKEMPIIARAEGHHIFDVNGNKYFDGLSGLFSVNAGHGRKRYADAASKQMQELDFFPLWSFAHPRAIELAERLLSYAPENMNRVFFTTGGGEAVETAWKIAKQYFKMTGKPTKHKVISRHVAYHGTSQGALSITGIPAMKKMFEPLVPSTFRIPNTNWYRAPSQFKTEEEFALWAANRAEEMILFEDPDTVAAIYAEPIQNSGGCFTAPPIYWQRLREICDKYDVLLVADETITGYGRAGTMFACEKYGIVPDMMVTAKGITSSYQPLGALLITERLFEPFKTGTNILAHGYTFAAHPVACAVALENLDVFDEEDLVGNVERNSAKFRKTLEKLYDLPIVGNIRGDGYFFAIELVKDKATKQTFSPAEAEKLLRGYLASKMLQEGLYARADDRGNPVIQLAPPLTIGQKEFDELEQMLRRVLTPAMSKI